VLLVLSIIALTNLCGFLAIEVGLFDKPMIVRLKPLNYVVVLAHGSWDTFRGYNNTYLQCHVTFYGDDTYYCTKELLDQLYVEGYSRVWLGQCHTGDREYMYYNSKDYAGEIIVGQPIEWYDWVSKNEKPGVTTVMWYGFGFVRL